MYQKVLVPLDGSELAECVLPHVESVIRDCKTTEVVFLRVVEPATLPIGTLTDGGATFTEPEAGKIREKTDIKAQAEAREYLEGLAKKVKYSGVSPKTEVLMGKPSETIADYAEKNNVDLIAIATHGRSGPSRFVWGSVADRILRSSCVPVLMVRGPGCYIGVSK